MKLATTEDVINYFYWSIPLNETIRAQKQDDNLVIIDKYNNRYIVSVMKEPQTEATN